jgi:hypothetical protein
MLITSKTYVLQKYNENDFFYLKSDGSLRNGFEIVSHPLSYKYLMSIKPLLKKMFAWLISNGATSHSNSTCGLHFHISRKAFKTDKQLDNFIYLNEKYADKLNKFSRRKGDFHWSAFRLNKDDKKLATEKKTKNLIIEKIKKGNASRYTAINLTNKNTIEIRYNKGTLRLETFIASAQLIYNIYQLAIVRNKTIETLDFKDLINKGKHRELIAYWTRLNTRTKTDQNDRADNQNKNREME